MGRTLVYLADPRLSPRMVKGMQHPVHETSFEVSDPQTFLGVHALSDMLWVWLRRRLNSSRLSATSLSSVLGVVVHSWCNSQTSGQFHTKVMACHYRIVDRSRHPPAQEVGPRVRLDERERHLHENLRTINVARCTSARMCPRLCLLCHDG